MSGGNSARFSSEAAKSETSSYNAVLELRISLQKSLELANRLPITEGVDDEALGEGSEELVEEKDLLCGEMHTTLEEFMDLLAVGDSGRGKRKRGASLDDHWKWLQAKQAKLEPKWHRTIEKWHARANFGSQSAKKSLNVFNTTILDSVNKAMDDEIWVMERSRPTFEDSRRLGKADDDDVATGHVPPARDVEVYDDRGFYSVLLKNFITNSSGIATEQSNLRKEDIEALRKYRQSRVHVDRKASKGRKLRYTVHAKLQNFMFPVPPAASDMDIDRLLSSLFQ